MTLGTGIAMSRAPADDIDARERMRLMEIGDEITYEGKRWILRGLDPMSVTDRRAELEDVETGERVSVPLAKLAADEV